MEIRWSPEAADEFVEIVAYLDERSGIAGRRTAHAIYDEVGMLASFPRLGRAGRVEGTRELFFLPYPFFAVYEIQDEAVVILRVVHGARRWP